MGVGNGEICNSRLQIGLKWKNLAQHPNVSNRTDGETRREPELFRIHPHSSTPAFAEGSSRQSQEVWERTCFVIPRDWENVNTGGWVPHVTTEAPCADWLTPKPQSGCPLATMANQTGVRGKGLPALETGLPEAHTSLVWTTETSSPFPTCGSWLKKHKSCFFSHEEISWLRWRNTTFYFIWLIFFNFN